MPWHETPPFPRGGSFMNGTPIDAVNDPTPGVQFEGKIYEFPDSVYGTGVPVVVRCIRNATGGLAYPSRAYVFDPAYLRQRINAIATVASSRVAILDELHAAAGVQNNDLVYEVVSGPCLVWLPDTAGANLVVAQGDSLVAVAAAGTTAADAGAVGLGTAFASTAASNNAIGRAMSAATTGNTHTQVLAMVEKIW